MSSMNAEGRSRRSTGIQSTTADKLIYCPPCSLYKKHTMAGAAEWLLPVALQLLQLPGLNLNVTRLMQLLLVGSSHIGPHLPAATDGTCGRPAMLLPLFVTLLPIMAVCSLVCHFKARYAIRKFGKPALLSCL